MSKAKASNRARGNRKQTFFTQEVKILIGLGVIVALVMAALVILNNSGEENVTSDDERLTRADSPTLGPEDAPVTIVEFLDPECESCRAMFPVVKDLMKKYEGQVRLVVRYFPLHNNSVLAASATEAAGEQGKYWEMQELLFEQQPVWGEQRTPQTEMFMQYANQLGLDMEQFTDDLNSEAYQEKIQRDKTDGEALAVRGTPTFFVNGQRITNLSQESLEAAIQAALE